MNQLTTTGIILGRTDFGEADRILTLLTPDYGKLRLMAKGVRKVKSKLAGGIELFSVSDIVFIKGRGDIGTLISARLQKHYGHIVEALDRTMLGYDLIKQLNRATEDEPEPEYFYLLQQAFEILNEVGIPLDLVKFWFTAQLLKLDGYSPNLQTDDRGKKLVSDVQYNFNFESMSFTSADRGRFRPAHIKFLRLCFADHHPRVLTKVQHVSVFLQELAPLLNTMRGTHLRK